MRRCIFSHSAASSRSPVCEGSSTPPTTTRLTNERRRSERPYLFGVECFWCDGVLCGGVWWVFGVAFCVAVLCQNVGARAKSAPCPQPHPPCQRQHLAQPPSPPSTLTPHRHPSPPPIPPPPSPLHEAGQVLHAVEARHREEHRLGRIRKRRHRDRRLAGAEEQLLFGEEGGVCVGGGSGVGAEGRCGL